MHPLLPVPCVVVLAFMAVSSPVIATETTRDTEPTPFTIPDTEHQIILGKTPAAPALPAPDLVAAIQQWLVGVLDMPPAPMPPSFQHAPRADMAAMWLGANSGERARTAQTGRLPQIEALYDSRNETIFLPADWSGATVTELSILVHEMVHHLQQVADLHYACAGRREEPAYRAQAEWLALFGTDLEEALQIDRFTQLVQTHCFY